MKRSDFLDKLAFIISLALSPYIISTVYILIIFLQFTNRPNQFLIYVVIAFVFFILIPAGYVLYLFEKKQIADLHINFHQQRLKPFAFGAASAVLGAIILLFLGAPRPILVLSIAYAVNSVILTLITMFWKISIHAATTAALVSMTFVLFGMRFWPLLLLLPPLYWSRIYRQRHSLAQLLWGSVVSFLLVLVIFYLFGYHVRW